MQDIATKLGVSIVTVSNALAGRDGVSAQMRQKICELAEEMGYKPSNTKTGARRAAAPKIGRNVGVLTSERFVGGRGSFYWELTASISNKLAAMNVCTVYECVTADAENSASMPNMIAESSIDCVIVIGQMKRNYVAMLSHISLPLLFVDFYDNRYPVDSVNSDSYYGGYILTDYLVGKGHRKIGFFGTMNATSSINDRFLGYIKCLMENELEYRKEWTIEDRLENGTIIEKISFPDQMPTAFVCNCDETAFRVISALKSKGVRVPEDISVVGYDNYTVASICIPTITTVEVDINKMAEEAVRIIERKLSSPDYREGRCIISGRLIEKDSVLDISGRH
ncbi:MAG: LacI family DNA-binding transcriptional regulator [Ruminococcus sp.]|nr:LacI family DNA-binding transcriptional regulator [Ruminococcus sp.]